MQQLVFSIASSFKHTIKEQQRASNNWIRFLKRRRYDMRVSVGRSVRVGNVQQLSMYECAHNTHPTSSSGLDTKGNVFGLFLGIVHFWFHFYYSRHSTHTVSFLYIRTSRITESNRNNKITKRQHRMKQQTSHSTHKKNTTEYSTCDVEDKRELLETSE